MNEPSIQHAAARLEQAREDAKQGRYAEALDGFQWFWDHALEHDLEMVGVRGSYLLGYWSELARDYSPAMQALYATCDKLEQALLATPDLQLLGDLSSITTLVEQPQRFVDVLYKLEAHWDELELRPHNHFWQPIADVSDWALFQTLPPSVSVELELAVESYELSREYMALVLPDLESWEQGMRASISAQSTRLLAALIDAALPDLQRELCEQIAQLGHQWWIEATIEAARGYGRQDLIDVLERV